MARGTVNKMIPKIRAVLSQQPVVRAWLFGSYSKGEETPDSDVDILVQYDEDARITLLTISRIMTKLSDAVGRKVDLVEDGCLLPFARESAERDKILSRGISSANKNPLKISEFYVNGVSSANKTLYVVRNVRRVFL